MKSSILERMRAASRASLSRRSAHVSYRRCASSVTPSASTGLISAFHWGSVSGNLQAPRDGLSS
jgi:hypothetical protein